MEYEWKIVTDMETEQWPCLDDTSSTRYIRRRPTGEFTLKARIDVFDDEWKYEPGDVFPVRVWGSKKIAEVELTAVEPNGFWPGLVHLTGRISKLI